MSRTITLTQGLVGGAVLPLSIGLYKILRFFYLEWINPLCILPHPPNPSFLMGNMKEILNAEASEMQLKWVKEYGSTFTFKGFLNMTQLYTSDTKALHHMAINSTIYQKPEALRYQLSKFIGEGLLLVEDDRHKHHRRIMNPAFGAPQIREITEIFVEKSLKLRDLWLAETVKEGGKARLDALSWLSRMTLDVIGLAGFNYRFDALETDAEDNELNKAFSSAFHTGKKMGVVPIIRTIFPSLRWLPASIDAPIDKMRTTMNRIGGQLLQESKKAVLSESNIEKANEGKKKDLLSLLVRANMSPDVAPHQQMSDEDVLAQIPTFLAAGHETTSTTTAWAIFALTKTPEVQAKLRDELFTLSTDNPSMDELNSLPYLDCVIRETLRLYPVLTATIRVAVKDDIVPLAQPVRDANGVIIAENLEVKKGQLVSFGVLPLNVSKDIWGDDASEFRPERWFEVPEAAMQIPGIWGNLFTFLGGPRACIGYRFAIVEMKAILFTLLRAFQLELAVPPSDIGSKGVDPGMQRPMIRSDKTGDSQMPIFVTPYTS
ncbi:cytochrome P450 [Panaeolus papilionaceus]|nr:cytochrome P450 [Panaeolus papilionaceus]